MKVLALFSVLFSVSASASEVTYLMIQQRMSASDYGASDESLKQQALKSAVQNAVNECREDHQGAPAATACVTGLSAGMLLKSHKSAGVRKAIAKVKLYCRVNRESVSSLELLWNERDGTNFSDCMQRVSVRDLLKQ